MRRQMGALLGLYCVLVVYVSGYIPLFEAPDAYYHFAVIEHIARTGQRPPTDQPQDHPWQQMTFHAPLYYYLAAALIAPLDTSDFPDAYRRNVHAQIGEPHATTNQNFVAHVGDPWHQTGLAVRIVRGLSMVLGAITLLSIYQLARYLMPAWPRFALLAAGIVLLNPQFLFMSGIVSNDNLVTALCTLGLMLSVRLWRTTLNYRQVLGLAVVVAGASLAKTSGLVIVPIAGLAVIGQARRMHLGWRQLLRYLLVMTGVWLVLAGWWYAENWLNHGDPFGTRLVAEATNTAPRSDIDWFGETRGLYFSFWGLFGWFNIIAPSTFYIWTLLLVGASGLGAVWGLRHWRHFDGGLVGLLSLYAVLFLVSWAKFMHLVVAGQGRLWFPLLGVIACGMAWGLGQLPSRLPSTILLMGMGVAVVAFPPLLIAPAYAPPDQRPFADWSPPSDAVAFTFREPWVDTACLTLWLDPAAIHQDAEGYTLDMTWQTNCPLSGYWSVFVHVVDLAQETCEVGQTAYILSQYDTMPADGNLPVPAFKVGHVVHDRLRVAHPTVIPAGAEVALQVGLYDAAGGSFIRALVEPLGVWEADVPFAVGQCAANVVVIGLE